MAVLTDEELEELMKQRGNEKLADHIKFESINGTVITNGKRYKFGEDFNLGDFVSVHSKKMNKMFKLQITSVTKTISNGVEILDIGFGEDILKTVNLR